MIAAKQALPVVVLVLIIIMFGVFLYYILNKKKNPKASLKTTLESRLLNTSMKKQPNTTVSKPQNAFLAYKIKHTGYFYNMNNWMLNKDGTWEPLPQGGDMTVFIEENQPLPAPLYVGNTSTQLMALVSPELVKFEPGDGQSLSGSNYFKAPVMLANTLNSPVYFDLIVVNPETNDVYRLSPKQNYVLHKIITYASPQSDKPVPIILEPVN